MKKLFGSFADKKNFFFALVVLATFFLIFWKVELSEQRVYDEWILESGNGSLFTAQSDMIQQMGVCMDDTTDTVSDNQETQQASLQISIYDKGGELVGQTEKTSAEIPVNTITAIDGLIKNPIYLHKGEE